MYGLQSKGTWFRMSCSAPTFSFSCSSSLLFSWYAFLVQILFVAMKASWTSIQPWFTQLASKVASKSLEYSPCTPLKQSTCHLSKAWPIKGPTSLISVDICIYHRKAHIQNPEPDITPAEDYAIALTNLSMMWKTLKNTWIVDPNTSPSNTIQIAGEGGM
jgi:hypothetical protein